MTIHLDEDIFKVVEKGIKNVEVRINDEKRRKLKIGDEITFLKRPLEKETLKAVVTDLKYYDYFEELVKDYEIERLYTKESNKEECLKLLKRFYTDDEEKEYGVVAIHFKLL